MGGADFRLLFAVEERSEGEMRFAVGSWKNASIVVKLMIAFVLVILPLYGISIMITHTSSKQMQTEVEKAHESKLYFYHNHLQFELERMSGLVTEFSFDDTMSTLSTRAAIMSRYEVTSSLNNIHNKLGQIMVTSPYISDVVYYVPALHKRVSAVDGIRNVEDTEWKDLLATMGNLNGELSYSDNNLYFLKSNPYNMNHEEPPNFILGIRLSEEELKHRLQQLAETGGSDITLSFGEQHNVLISSSDEPVSAAQLHQVSPDSPESMQVTRYQSDPYLYYSLYDPDHSFTLTASIPNDVLQAPLEQYNLWLWTLTLISIVIIMIFSFSIYRSIHKPLSVLIRGFRMAEQGQTSIHIPQSRRDEFGYLYSRFNHMIERLHILIDENYVARIRTSEAELKHLQSQIQPHFLYNSLFSIKQMAEVENVELIQEFTDYLGQYFRYMSRDSHSEVSLGEEVDHALVYASIQKIRFGSRVQLQLEELSREYRDIAIPRVIIQPIVENVFEHALAKRSQGGILKLSYQVEHDKLSIRIEDDGDQLTDEVLSSLQESFQESANQRHDNEEITGLMNVNQRLRIKFGAGYGLCAQRSALGGLCMILNIPWRRE
ncbi:two-component system sensor histidine kinase YesM [Paenibacillus pabuli]|uniref:Two-component system sensor histidine kinase YesM n=2 Tax=Paenibacillus TaxID=44249 RepID=A0A855Y594_9BACL|nr:two-component system sensor histidine kinase YesM [Paenibacillus pabuli]PXW04088.1 two-component system sensor histidine kinase YesM [Paenibacillus taichungensis]